MEYEKGLDEYSDAELCSLVDSIVQSSPSADGSALTANRRLNYDYYYGLRPGPGSANGSDYVSWEVFESVEASKAKLLKTFASNRNVVRWKPTDERDVDQADIRTRAVNAIIDGGRGRSYKLLHDLFHDGLISRLAAVKRVHRQRKVSVQKRFDRVPFEQLQAAAMGEEVSEVVIESEEYQTRVVPTPLGPVPTRERLASGYVEVLEDRSGIDLEVIPPECVHFSPCVTDLSDVESIPALVIEYRRTRYQLLQDGFSREVVDKLHVEKETFKNPGRSNLQSTVGSSPSYVNWETEEIQLEEGYVWLTRGEVPVLCQIVKSGTTVLVKERVDEIPLRFWTPFPVSHEAIGQGMADITLDLQAGSSAAIRGVIDNVHRVNAGVRMANLALIRNPADLIDNPIGGIIDTERPMDAMNLVPQPSLSPATMGLLELMSLQKEQRTGDTRMSRGLNARDVVTHQNSADMIDQLIEASGDRPMMLARGFAELCWRPLMLDVYRLAVENDVSVTIEVDGKYQAVRLSQFPFSDQMEIDTALTPDYGDQQARKTLMAHQLLGGDPILAPLYTMEERYALVSEVFHLLGMPNWLANPRDPVVASRLQLLQQQQQRMQQLQLQQAGAAQQREERKVATQEQKLQVDSKLKKEEVDLDSAKSAAAQNLDEREFAWQQQVDIAELNLESRQRRAVRLGSL